jgi:uncharacterized protein (DUF736 family)
MELANFQIWKNTQKKEGSNQPDFRITAKIDEKFEEVGACWWKQDSKGNYYQSCSVKTPESSLSEEEREALKRQRELEDQKKREMVVNDGIPF